MLFMDKIIMDNKSFRALSAQSRVGILNRLKERRMTLSELSNKLALKNSTVKEHCDLLLDAQLVKKIDEGRKWKYYELTNKGKQIIEPNPFIEAKSIAMLSIAAIIFTSILLFSIQGIFLNNNSTNYSTFNSKNTSEDNMLMTTMIEDNSQIKTIQNLETNENITPTNINYNLFSITIITTLIIGIFAGWIVGRKS